MKRYLIILVIFLLLPVGSSAQEDECAALIDRALSEAAAHCGDLAPGTACFGHGDIMFTTRGDAATFAAAGDTLDLDTTCCMRLSPMQLPDAWGVAVMNVQPDARSDSLAYVLFGDVEIHNAASSLAEIEVRVESDTPVYAGPGSHYATFADVGAGEILYANACNCTQNWLRVRLPGGEIGWVPARRVTILGQVEGLPVAGQDTPVYAGMQAFTFHSGAARPPCEAAPENGILIQAPAGGDATRLWVNGVDILLAATVFARAEPEGELSLDVLDGSATIRVADETIAAPPGVRVAIPLSGGYASGDHLKVTPTNPDDLEHLPLALLPRAIDPAATFDNPMPLIIGQRACQVVSDRGETACALHFVNLDGDAIVRMTSEFVYAPQGKWEGSVREFPAIQAGDTVSGDLEWRVSCSLGGANFIGPVIWSITITDEAGHVSEPFEASFNCVDG